jgi:hypothetical protein
MLEVVLNFFWTIIIVASLAACTVAVAVVYVTRKLD